MNDKQLIDELKLDRYDNASVDEACVERLEKVAKQYGLHDDGQTALDLLKIIRRILDI